MPLVMPSTPGFTDCDFGLVTNTQKFTSPLSKATQRVLLGGAMWGATYVLPRMNRPQAAPWMAFLLALEGGVNTFYGFDPDCKNPRGVATGTPLVAGGSQTGSTLAIDGCTANVIGWALAGDYFEVNGELKMLTANANTNGSGQTTLSFKPALRDSPADNAAMSFVKASCTMALVDDTQTRWKCDMNGIYEAKSFSAMEVFS